ncbi:MAG: hypothetical protein AAFO97_10070 [Pseudomonadota bacterium]
MRRSFFKGAAAVTGMLLLLFAVLFVAETVFTTETASDTSAEPSYSVELDGVEETAAEEEWQGVGSLLDLASTIGGEASGNTFRKCAACHGLEPGVHGVGPSLYRIVGKDIASTPGFSYSAALLSLPGVWTVEALDSYLANPKGYAPGTSMAFAGLRDPRERLSVISAILDASVVAPPPPLEPDLTIPAPEPQPVGVINPAQPTVIGPSTPSTQPSDPWADLVESQLKSADIAFNRPDTMQLGQATSVELVLSPATAPRAPVAENASTQDVAESIGLSSALPGTTQVVEDVQYALLMEAEISGLGFDVHPPGPQRQTVLPFQAAKWVWTIKPKSAGSDQVFTVNVNAIIQRDNENLPPVRITTFTERITVEVTLMQQILNYAQQLTTLNAAIAGVGGTVFAVVAWLWARTRKKKKPEPAKPSEVVVTHKFEQDT